MEIYVDESPVGVGKTHTAIERAVKNQGLWLFAVERIDSIKEIAQRVQFMADQKNITLIIVPISSQPDEAAINRGGSVRTEVESLADKYQNSHVIAICSHSAMMMTDFSKFKNWHFICDEVPALLDIEKKQTRLDRAFFEKYFELEELTSGTKNWSLFKPSKEGLKLTGSDFIQDESHKHLAKLHLISKLADEGKIVKFPVTTLTSFAEMEGDQVYWVWWSLLSINHFEVFKSVTFLASRFMKSMTRKIIDNWNKDVAWSMISKPSLRSFKDRGVKISYYSTRKSTINFLSGSDGQKHLSLIAADIEKKTQETDLIWSCNEKLRPALSSQLSQDAYRTPKQAGTDTLMEKTQAAMFYSAQPANYVRDILDVFELSENDWVKTNEYETILQFVSRTSVRDANSSDDVEIYVYNKFQADYLAKFFEEQQHNAVSCEYVNLKLVYPDSKRGPKKKILSHKERLEKDNQIKENRRIAQKKRRKINKYK